MSLHHVSMWHVSVRCSTRNCLKDRLVRLVSALSEKSSSASVSMRSSDRWLLTSLSVVFSSWGSVMRSNWPTKLIRHSMQGKVPRQLSHFWLWLISELVLWYKVRWHSLWENNCRLSMANLTLRMKSKNWKTRRSARSIAQLNSVLGSSRSRPAIRSVVRSTRRSEKRRSSSSNSRKITWAPSWSRSRTSDHDHSHMDWSWRRHCCCYS